MKTRERHKVQKETEEETEKGKIDRGFPSAVERLPTLGKTVTFVL